MTIYKSIILTLLQYEKVFCPFAIVSKKRYIGAKYEFDPNKFKVKAMGLSIQRRDTAVLCLEAMNGFLDRVFKDKNITDAKYFIEKYISDMFNDLIPLEKYVITKKIAKAEYKVVPGHILEWQRERTRLGNDDVEAVGERMEFIIREHDKRDGLKNAVVRYQRAVDQDIKNTDKMYYFTTFIKNPLEKLMEYICGQKETDRILNPNNYQKTRTVKASNNNLLSFFGVSEMKTRKRHIRDDSYHCKKLKKK